MKLMNFFSIITKQQTIICPLLNILIMSGILTNHVDGIVVPGEMNGPLLPQTWLIDTDLVSMQIAETDQQSDICNPQQDKDRVQCFSQVPAAHYEVLEGETARLRCRVKHQKGKAQWSAGSFLLGYDRTIPGRQRFHYEGDPIQGQHDLVIEGVVHSDTGEYECQVSPAEGEQLLRKRTRLVILISPSAPIIRTPVGEPQPSGNNRIIIPTGFNMEPIVKLTCKTKGGYPKPKIEWFYNGNKVISNKEEIQTDLNKNTTIDNIISEEYQLTLELPRDSLTNGDRLICIVTNQATLRSTDLERQKLRQELSVILNRPSGKPKIYGVKKSLYRDGDEIEAHCSVSPAGVPAVKLSWKWSLSNERISLRHYRDSEENVTSLTGLVITPKQHGDDLICSATHTLGYVLTDAHKIYVTHEFKNLKIAGPIEEAWSEEQYGEILKFTDHTGIDSTMHVYIDKGKRQLIGCITDEYYGLSEIIWYARDTSKVNNNDWKRLENLSVHELNATQNPFSHQMLSLLQVDNLIDNYKQVKCEAYFENVFMKRILVDLEEMVQLSKPVITNLNSSSVLFVNSLYKVECESSPANPSPMISWFDNDSRYLSPGKLIPNNDGYFSRKMNNGKVTSIMNLQVTAEHHGKYIFCATSSSTSGITMETISNPVRLNVSFLQSDIDIKGKSSTNSIEITSQNTKDDIRLDRMKLNALNTSLSGTNMPFTPFLRLPFIEIGSEQEISLHCTSGLSNPQANIIWRHWKCPGVQGGEDDPGNSLTVVTEISKSMDIQQSCHYEILPDAIQVITTLPEVKGIRVKSVLTLKTIAEYDSDIFECITQQNTHGVYGDPDTKLIPSVFSRGIQTLVRSKPNFNGLDLLERDRDTDSLQFVISEGNDFLLDLKPMGNPMLNNVQWLRNSKPFTSITQSDLINFDDLKYKRVHVNPSNGELKLKNVNYEDMANYTIIAENSLGSSQITFFLNITHSPKLIGNAVVNITSDRDEAELECLVKANPIPNSNAIRWRKIGDGFIDLPEIGSKDFSNNVGNNRENPFASGITCGETEWTGAFKYSTKCSLTKEGLLLSKLSIRKLEATDVGRYQCFIDNGIGSPAVKIIDLIYPFKSKFLPLSRWSRAAPSKLPPNFFDNAKEGSNLLAEKTSLTCVFTGEPEPKVFWTREPSNQTLIEGGQFSQKTDRIGPGLYRARLIMNHVRPTDLGKYYCRGSNIMGSSVGSVDLMTPSQPDMPTFLKVVNKTATTLTLSWYQGYNGGQQQTFQIRAALNDNPSNYLDYQVNEDVNVNLLIHMIRGLKKASTYRISISAKNEIYGTRGFTETILVSTSDSANQLVDIENNLMGDEGFTDTNSKRPYNSNPSAIPNNINQSLLSGLNGGNYDFVKIITIACIIGVLIVMANILLVGFIVKKKCRKNIKTALRESSTILSKMEPFDPLVNGYPNCQTFPNNTSGHKELFLNSHDYLYMPSTTGGSVHGPTSQYNPVNGSCTDVNGRTINSPFIEHTLNGRGNYETNSMKSNFCMPHDQVSYDGNLHNPMLSSVTNMLDDSSRFLFTGSNNNGANRNPYLTLGQTEPQLQTLNTSATTNSLSRNGTLDRVYQPQTMVDYEYNNKNQLLHHSRAVSPSSSTGIGTILNNPRYGYATHLQPNMVKYSGRVSLSPCIPTKNMTTSFHMGTSSNGDLFVKKSFDRITDDIQGAQSNQIQRRPSFNPTYEQSTCDGFYRHIPEASSLLDPKLIRNNRQASVMTETSGVVIPPPSDFEGANAIQNHAKNLYN